MAGEEKYTYIQCLSMVSNFTTNDSQFSSIILLLDTTKK